MARPVFEPSHEGPFGGSEVRAFVFATGLARQGRDVQVVVHTHAPPPPLCIHGVTLRYCRLPAPLPRLRDEPRITHRCLMAPWLAARRLGRSLQKRYGRRHANRPHFDRQLARLNADVYCCFGVHRHAASVIHTATRIGRSSLLFVASDTDLSDSYCGTTYQRNAYGQRSDICRYAIDHASQIVVQTRHQQKLLQQRFNRHSTVIRNPISLEDDIVRAVTSNRLFDVLWIGRADCFSKRADLAIQVAQQCPDLQFTLIMNPRDQRVFRKLIASVPGNARVVSHVPWTEVDEYFRSTGVLLNTSDAEGFPNTFLQAARQGVPIVSLRVDPDGMLNHYGCGVTADGDLARTAELLRRMTHDHRLRRQLAAAGREYLGEFHEAAARCDQLSDVLDHLIQSPSPVDVTRTAA